MSPIWLLVLLLSLISLLVLVGGMGAMRKRAFARGGLGVAVGLVVLALALGTGAAAWSLARFEALTRETTAAVIDLEPLGERRFRATVHTGTGEARTFDLRGDQIWVDARIVKWHPYANMMGLHTAYRLERIGGRYRNLDDERTAPRTVESLAEDDFAGGLFDWADRQRWLGPLIDAEYGSGSFVPAGASRSVQVRVSTTGLLIRDVPTLD